MKIITYEVVGDNSNNGINDKQKHANVGVVTNIPNGDYKTDIDNGKSGKNLKVLLKFKVDKIDREYQFWKRSPLSVKIINEKVLLQKINYIHSNVNKKEGNDIDYKYSSAYYYETSDKNWGFLL